MTKRTREEIEKSCEQHNEDWRDNKREFDLIIELLLDIRDLLTKQHES